MITGTNFTKPGESKKLNTLSIVVTAMIIFSIAAYGGDRFFSHLSPDFVKGYHPGALSMQQDFSYLDRQGRPITHWPPGYSILIAPFAHPSPEITTHRLRWIIAILSAFNVVLLFSICRHVLPDFRNYLLLPILVLWPPLIPLVNPNGSEMLFSVLVNLAVLILLKLSQMRDRPARVLVYIILAGILVGLSILTRAMGVAVAGGIILAILIAWKHREMVSRIATIALTTSVIVLTILPWVLALENVTGKFQISTSAQSSAVKGFEDLTHFKAGKELALPEHWTENGDPVKALIETSMQYPVSTAGVVLTKLARPWYFMRSGRFNIYLLLINLPIFILTVCAMARTLKVWNRAAPDVILLLGVFTACWAAASVTASLFRYLAPVLPLAMIVIAWHVNDWKNSNNSRLEQTQSGK